MHTVDFAGDHITLAQLLKKIDVVSSGGEVKDFLLTRQVLVNGMREQRRGKKLHRGDAISIDDQDYQLV